MQMSSSVYVEFDGSSKGNPGKAGAGAVILSGDCDVITRVREGLGIATNNEAEYCGLKLGLKTAKNMGYRRVYVRGDSELVVKQVSGEWKTRSQNMSRHCNEALQLMGQFEYSEISYIPRELNSAADEEANKAVGLPAGEVYQEDGPSNGGRHRYVTCYYNSYTISNSDTE